MIKRSYPLLPERLLLTSCIAFLAQLQSILNANKRLNKLCTTADLQSIISDMKEDNCSKFYIWFVVLLHITSVSYHAFFFKLKDYFYHDK